MIAEVTSLEQVTKEVLDLWNENWPEPGVAPADSESEVGEVRASLAHLLEPESEPDIVNGTREVERVTDEELNQVLQEHGRIVEPEIAREQAAKESSGEVGTQSYISDHPTTFNYYAVVQRQINRMQAQLPWLTYVNTYWWHPPYSPPAITRRYDSQSWDTWGAGFWNGKYAGYRGKPIGTALRKKAFRLIWNDLYPPNILWVISGGGMWVRGQGWMAAPWGPPDSDPGHFGHIHTSDEI